MGGYYQVSCRDCDYEQIIANSSDYAYRLPNPPDVFLWSQFAWCNTCDNIVKAEHLQLPEETERWVKDCANQYLLRDAERYQEVLRTRISPPRCLHCGDVDIIAALKHSLGTTEPTWTVTHLACGGELVIGYKIYARLPCETKVYTPEGQFLERIPGILLPGQGYGGIEWQQF
jgi:hypothetical protein